MLKKRLNGIVRSGLGRGAYFISQEPYRSFFKGLLGKPPFPGTLNVELNSDWIEELPLKNHYQPANKGGFWYYLGEIENLKIVVIRPDKSKHPNNILEIVASEYLRDLFDLTDGDRISFYVFI